MAYMDDGVDQRLVKRGKFGPLDIYPQEDKQKEDDLNPEFVKSGFKYGIPDLLKEYEFHTIANDSRDDQTNKPSSLINIQKERNKKDSNLDNDIVRLLLSIVNKREEAAVNSQTELNKKQQGPPKPAQTFKPSLIFITGNQKTKEQTYAWFKQLANNEPLAKLAKKIPVFNKRADNLPEIIIIMHEYQVPVTRAVWYLKIMVLAYSTNLNEVNKKKRQPNIDAASEWSIPIVKFLNHIYIRLQFIEQHFQQNPNLNPNQINIASLLNSNSFTLESFMNVENLNLLLLSNITPTYLTENKLKQLWDFTTKLMKSMLDQNLLDKQYILEQLVDLLERSHTNRTQPNTINENSTVKLLLNTIAQNMHYFLQSELLSRRLAYYCCKRISLMFNEFSQKFFEPTLKHLQNLSTNKTDSLPSSSSSSSSTTTTGGTSSLEINNYILKKNVSVDAIKLLFDKFADCPAHRNQTLLLLSIVQSIELGCMQALIWNQVGDGKTESPYNGSPLDLLPLPPSKLLYTYEYPGVSKQTYHSVRDELEKTELCIKRRSIAIENKWSTDKLKQPAIGIIQTKILNILDILDKHCYDLADVESTLDKLYSQIFPKIKLYLLNRQCEKASDLSDLISQTETASSNQPTSEQQQQQTADSINLNLNSNEMNKPLSEKEIIFLLCDWATTTKRCGQHRLFYAVFLIRKRQLDWINQFREVNSTNKTTSTKKESTSGETTGTASAAAATAQDEATQNKKRKFKSISASSDEEETSKKKQTNSDESFAKKLKLDEHLTVNQANKLTVVANPVKNKQNKKVKPAKLKINSKNVSFNYKLIKKLTSKLKQKQEILDEKARRLEKSKQQQLKRIQKEKELNKKLQTQMYEYLFQNILFEYLETRAASLDESSHESRLKFTNLVSLFYMLINCKLFSHDQFVCTLISRGETFKNNLNYIQRPIQAILMRSTHIVLNQTSKDASSSGTNQQQQLQGQKQANTKMTSLAKRKSVDYSSPMSVYQQPASMPPYQMPPHTPLQAQKSFNNDPIYNAPHSVPTPSKSSSSNLNNLYQDDAANANNTSYENIPRSVQASSAARLKANKILARIKQQYLVQQQMKPMSKLAQFVLHFAVPQTSQFLHERNQRSVVLYGFGVKKQEILENISSMNKNLMRLFCRKSSIDLSDLNATNANDKRAFKYVNIITSSNFTLSSSEQDHLTQLSAQYLKMTYYDQYSIVNKLNTHILDIYHSLDTKNYLPKLQYLQFVFDLMEANLNVFNLLLFALRLLHCAPLLEQYLKKKFSKQVQQTTSRQAFFEYLSYFYLNLIGIFRMHLLSLVLWKDLASEVFKCLFKLIRSVERPTRCSSHEKCTFALLNEMFLGCSYLRVKFPQFEPISQRIKSEKIFIALPSLERLGTAQQMRPDETLANMIITADYTIDDIEQYITRNNCYYNFVAHVFVSVSTLNKDETIRVANLCAELSNRNNVLIAFWQQASKALYHRNTEMPRERSMFNELPAKINIQNARSRENFKLFLSILAARNCLILNEFIIMVVKTCVMACPGIMADQSHNFSVLEPSAWLACHILQYLFTSASKPLVYRNTTFDRRMLAASFRSISFNSFLLVLKGIFLLSHPNREGTQTSGSQRSNNRNNRNQTVVNSASSSSSSSSSANSNSEEPEQNDIEQYASNVLHEICEHDWIRERCFNEGDNLLKVNQLLEPALGRRAQILLHIIFYPRNHYLRKQNEQTSTKDFIKIILQNLDIWTLRESLLEFKLMIELQKQKDNPFEYFVECLAKTTVDFLLDPDKPAQPPFISRSISSNSSNQQEMMFTEDSAEPNNDLLKSPEPADELNNENAADQRLALSDFAKNYEPDSIYNFDLDSSDSQDNDELELLRIHKQNQPVGIWLVAPLIGKLQDNCQQRVLDHATRALNELNKSFWSSKTKSEKEANAIKNITAWNQKPFFALLISCVKSKDEQRPLLTSLFNGLCEFVNSKEDKIISEDPRLKQIMLETLHVRLSLVGSMFDFILKNSSDFLNWAWLFVQLIYLGVVDPDTDQLLFTMVVDMLVILIHHIITLEPALDNNKQYQAIIKKISKETKDFSDVPNTRAINHIRRIMPLNRNACLDVMTVDPYAITTTKTCPTSLDKRKGFKFLRKEKISTWELIEGVKNASSLCMSWYGSSKIERKMLRYEYQQKLLVRHKHLNLHKELTYFKEKPDLPNDIVEIAQQIVIPPPTPPAITAPPATSAPNAMAAAASNPSIMHPQLTKKPSNLMLGPQNMNLISNDNSMSMSPSLSSPSLHQQPGMMQMGQNSADIVILGSTAATQPIPNQMHPNQIMMNQPPNTMPPYQQAGNQLIKERLQNTMNSGYPQQMMHQQQQQQMMQQQQQQQQHIANMQMNQQQLLNDKSKQPANRQMSTPDKQQRAQAGNGAGGSAKKRTNTPRARANAAAGRGGAVPAGVVPPPANIQISQPNLMAGQTMPSQLQQQPPQLPGQVPQQQKLMQQPMIPQQQQQQQGSNQIQQQRSTNSPMLVTQQQQPQQQPQQFQPGMPNAPNYANRPMGMNNVPNQQQMNQAQIMANPHGQPMPNQRMAPNQQGNFAPNNVPLNGAPPTSSNPAMNQFQTGMPPQSSTPQPGGQQPPQQQNQFGQQPQQQQQQQRIPNPQMMPQQQGVPRMPYPGQAPNQPTQGAPTNLNIPNPGGSATSTLQQQLGQQPQQPGRKIQPQVPPLPQQQPPIMVNSAQQQQQQKQQAPMYNQMNQPGQQPMPQQANRLIQPNNPQQQPQQQQQVYPMNNSLNKPIQNSVNNLQRNSTPPDPISMMPTNPQQMKFNQPNDPNMMAKQQQAQFNNSNPNFMMQQQQQQQQRMQVPGQPPPQQQFMNQQANWQQRPPAPQQQQQNIQQRPQQQQPQQFANKQQSSQIPMNANTNGNNMLQGHVMQQQQQQQQPRQLPNTQQYQTFN